jgi:hypothetical protein
MLFPRRNASVSREPPRRAGGRDAPPHASALVALPLVGSMRCRRLMLTFHRIGATERVLAHDLMASRAAFLADPARVEVLV